MKTIGMQKVIITLVFAIVACFGVNALEANAAASASGYVGAWYGDSASNSADYTNSDGHFGVIKDSSGTMFNKPEGTGNPPSPVANFYKTSTVTADSSSYGSNSGKTSGVFTISPNRGGTPRYKITFIKYRRSDSATWNEVTGITAAQSKADYSLTISPLVEVTRSGKKGSYTYSATGYTYYIWAGFEEDTVDYKLTGSIDTSNHTAALETCDTDAATTITATSPLVAGKYNQWPTVVGGVNTASITATSSFADPTPTTVFTLNTASTCEIASITYDGVGPVTGGLSGSPPYLSGTTYTKDIDKTTTFKVLFRKQTVLITATVDPASPAACTSGTSKFSQAGGYFVKYTDQSFSISTNTGCQIESVIVTDAGSTPTHSGTDVLYTVGEGYDKTLNKYTFKNIQSAGSITVKFAAVASADKAYCQLPPFMLTNAALLPNVLILFDNSGSMGNNRPLTSTAYNCNETHTAASLGVTGGCNEFRGYFNTSTMYSLSGSVYTIMASGTKLNLSDSSGANKKMSGNYLNWSIMNKVDVIRKILIGGKVAAAGTVSGGVYRGSSGTKYLELFNSNVPLYVEYSGTTDDPEGVVHSVFDTTRLGMMVFTSDSKHGRISAPFGTAKEVLIEQMENDTDPNSSTPLAASLYEALHYFRGDTSAATGVNYSDATIFPIDAAYTRHAIQASCQKHFIVVITDGVPNENTYLPGDSSHTSNLGSAGNALFDMFKNWIGNSTLTVKPPSGSDYDSARVAYFAHTNDILTGTRSNDIDLYDTTKIKNNINVFTVYTFDTTNAGEAALQQAAKFGSFDESKRNEATTGTNHNGMPDKIGEFGAGTVASPTSFTNYFKSMDPTELEKSIERVFSNIGAMSASGTAAAVANNKSGERGANMLQALFYPVWKEDNSVKWLGEVQALWYYLDPVIGYSGIYEDTNKDSKLNLAVDQLISSDPQSAKALWRAGSELHKRAYSDRKIYTFLGSNSALTDGSNAFTLTDTLRKKMNLGLASQAGALTNTQVTDYIDYIKGLDKANMRSRKVTYTNPSDLVTTTNEVWKLGDIVNSTPMVQSSVPINAYNIAYSDLTYESYIKSTAYANKNVVYTGSNDGLFHAFRLGKVTSINEVSNPLLIAEMSTANERGKEEWAYIPSNALPYITNQAGSGYCHQCLVDGAPIVTDASIYRASGGAYWNGERTASSWQSVVVSSMGLGGASRDSGTNCNETYSPDLIASNNKDCVKAPATPTGLTSYPSGLSSYFALNVTDPLAPKFMWEFSDAQIPAANKAYNHNASTAVVSSVAAKGLGFTTPSAAIIRINAVDTSTPPKVVKKNNGRWFAVMASGPTGAITSSLSFTGHSDQNLKIYVVDLNGVSDPTVSTPFIQCTSAAATNSETGCNFWVMDTGIPFAFANSLNGAAMDLDRSSPTKDGNYSDDVVYITYTKASLTHNGSNPAGDFPTSDTAWNKGGVIRLVTNHNPDPFTWFTSKLIDDIGPITTSIGRIQDKANKKLWVYFGEGRSFYPGDETVVKDSLGNYVPRSFYGVADPCYTQYGEVIPSVVTADNSDANFALGKTPATCTAVLKSDLQVQNTPTTNALELLKASTKGWYVDMAVPASSTDTAGAERVVSDVTAAFNGTIFFTTYSPNSDPCTAGGSTSIWAVKYNTGGTPSAESMQGKAPVQTSSGGIKLIDLATAFTEKDGRKLAAGLAPAGMAPKGKFPPLLSPKAAKRIINIQEQ